MRMSRAIAILSLALWMPGALGAPAVPSASATGPRIVQITARRYRFEPSTVTLKRGETVELVLHSGDRVHGFMNKALGFDTDIPAGKTTVVTITPHVAGSFTTICDHYCGLGHNGMKMTIIVQ